jgi:FixJ family two-component response regulator
MTNPARPIVLLAGSDPAVAHAVQFCFGIEGLDVHEVLNVDDLTAFKGLPRDSCLILDHHPPSLNGLDLLERLRAEGVQTSAVLITTNPRADFRARAASAGVPIVEKPLLTDDLLTAVRCAIAASRDPAQR